MAKKVIVLGGGMGGLAATHELLKAGYTVELYERQKHAGGKAKSGRTPEPDGSSAGGAKPAFHLPDEHGFRFFPGFYKHVDDTMRDIPSVDPDKKTVFDHLVPAPEITLALPGKGGPLVLPAHMPNLRDGAGFLEMLLHYYFVDQRFTHLLGKAEILWFLRKLLCLYGSGPMRRNVQYDLIPWSEFIDADKIGGNYQLILANGLTRSLVAMQPERGSTRTVGTILMQILWDIVDPAKCADRLLDGPTTEVWIEPWMKRLQDIGGSRFSVRYHAEIVRLNFDGTRIVSATVRDAKDPSQKCFEVGSPGDHFICALPVDVLQCSRPSGGEPVMSNCLKAAAGISGIDVLECRWMSGMQFYLKSPVAKPPNGHVIYLDSPWALTSIEQQQFWLHSKRDLRHYGDGEVGEIFSAIISEWDKGKDKDDAHGPHCPEASECTTPEQVLEYAWAQLKAHRAGWPGAELDDSNRHSMWLDKSVHGFGATLQNQQPLLVNTVGSARNRPDATTAIPNLFLASDYVRTNTDLATMEGANEAGRRAVLGILDADDPHRTIPRPGVWKLEEPGIFHWFKVHDDAEFKSYLDKGGHPADAPPPLIWRLLEPLGHRPDPETGRGDEDASERHLEHLKHLGADLEHLARLSEGRIMHVLQDLAKVEHAVLHELARGGKTVLRWLGVTSSHAP